MEAIEPYRIESKYFDDLYGGRSKEARFYSGLASNYGKRVLELGVGTAALAIPLASEGYQVVGIDNSPDMLAVAEGKLGECDQSVRQRLRLMEGDMRAFDLAEKDFDFAFIAFNTFLHLLNHEEEIDCLHRIHGHLRPKGGLAIDVFQLDPRRPEGVLRLSHAVKTQSGELVRYYQQSMDYAEQLMNVNYVYQISEDGVSRTFAKKYRLRILLRGELELLLDKAGFQVVSVFGSFEREPHSTASGKMIMLAESR